VHWMRHDDIVHKLDSFEYRVFVTTGFYVSPLFQLFVFNIVFVGFVVTELVFNGAFPLCAVERWEVQRSPQRG
jgi:hypothetical protein